jgi:lipopolysaccharide export system protein LptC
MRRIRLSIVIMCVILSVALVACGSNATTGSGGNSSTPTTTAQMQKCGKIQTLPNGKLSNTVTAKGIENCFWQHFQTCQPASLIFISTGVDTITTHTFTVQNKGGQCAATDSVQLQIIPAKAHPAQTFTCASVSQQQAGLQFSQCGSEGTITVPVVVGML